MRTNAYLTFNGQCREAFEFYVKALGAEIEMMSTFADSPMAQQMPADMHDKIIHARIRIGEATVMGSDAPAGRYTRPQGFSVALGVDAPAEAERIFAALSEGGHVGMALQETFFAARFGMAVDRFGIPWMVNCQTAASGSGSS